MNQILDSVSGTQDLDEGFQGRFLRLRKIKDARLGWLIRPLSLGYREQEVECLVYLAKVPSAKTRISFGKAWLRSSGWYSLGLPQWYESSQMIICSFLLCIYIPTYIF